MSADDRCGVLARRAAMNADKSGSGMIANRFAHFNFFFGLFVRHASIDALEDFLFTEPGVF